MGWQGFARGSDNVHANVQYCNEIIEHLSQLVGQYKERLFAISIMSNSISIGWNENGTHEDLEHFNRWSTELTQLFEDEMAIEE